MQTWSWALAPSPGLLHLTAVPITGPIARAADTEHSPGASPRSGGRWTRGAGAVDGSVSCSGAWLMGKSRCSYWPPASGVLLCRRHQQAERSRMVYSLLQRDMSEGRRGEGAAEI